MSRGSTFERTRRRNVGLPVTSKEKLRIATLTLLKIALQPANAQEVSMTTLRLLGIKPKEQKKEVVNEPEAV